MNYARQSLLLEFCKSVGLSFSNLNLLELAFHHRSYSNEVTAVKSCNSKKINMQLQSHNHNKDKDIDTNGLLYPNNERLEFLGDSVLSLVTTNYLYHNMPLSSEGEMSKIKAQAVSEFTLAKVARKFGIDKLLVLGHGEELSGGRQKDALLADCVESIIGAYYLDKGFDAANVYVLSFIVYEIKLIQQSGTGNWKSKLQELFQEHTQDLPVYTVVSEYGPDHNKTFLVDVTVKDFNTGKIKHFGPCQEHSKRKAEQLAAKLAYQSLKKI